MNRGKRCIRLTYAHDFHLDIVPACSNAVLGYGQIRIPDRELKNWRDGNSRAYIDWFNKQAVRVNHKIQDRSMDHAEPLPKPESLEDKPALKYAVQLFKRYRNIAFIDMPDMAPVSIVISTLCAQHYQGQTSVNEAVSGILAGVATSIRQNQGKRLQVWNPANNVPEDLGERWENEKAYTYFVNWIAGFCRLWQQLSEAKGYEEISRRLEALFGEQPTKDVIREDGTRLSQNRLRAQLGISSETGMLTSHPNAIRVPNNTFYGQ
jgi:hypothetical protein